MAVRVFGLQSNNYCHYFILETQLKKLILAAFGLFSVSAIADTYEVLFDSMGASPEVAYITNTNSFKTMNINLEEVQRIPNTFSLLDDGSGVTYSGGAMAQNEYLKITDIKDSIVEMSRLQNAVTVGVYSYGRLMTYNTTTSQVTSDKLIAYNDADYDYAKSKGYEVIRAQGTNVSNGGRSYNFASYSPNTLSSGAVDTKGGLFAQNVMDNEGNSLVRKESDGSVHVGQNSFVFRDSAISSNGNDILSSSVNRLQLGDNPNHRTIVQGTLEVQDPTAPNHAANKGYVDSNFYKRNYIDGSVAMAMAMSSLPRSLNGKTMLGIGTGYHNGQAAVAVGLSKSLVERGLHFNISVSHSNAATTSGAASVGYEF